MLVTYRHLLRPTSGQRVRLDALLEMQRQLYNAALEERIGAWRRCVKTITRFDQFRSLTMIRADDPDGHGACSVAWDAGRSSALTRRCRRSLPV